MTIRRFFAFRAPGMTGVARIELPEGEHAPMDVARFLCLQGGLPSKACTCCGVLGPLASTEWREETASGDGAAIEQPWRTLTAKSRAMQPLGARTVH
jgi:hypothetical protein